MRVVVDTNVLVSGLLTPHGPPARVVDLMVGGGIVPLYDDRILHEYRAVLERERFGFDPRDVDHLLAQVISAGEHVTPDPWPGELADPDDRPFLEVAISARARAVVTGNRGDFEPRVGDHSVTVVSPRGLVNLLRRPGGPGAP